MSESTPEVASAPEPVSPWPFRIAPASVSRVAALGAVLSTVTVRGGGGEGVSGGVGGDDAEVVVAVGEGGGVPVGGVGGVRVGGDRRPGAAACGAPLELGGVDAGAGVGRVGRDGDRAAAQRRAVGGAVSEPVGSVASKGTSGLDGVSALPTSSVAKTLTV